MRRLAGLFLLLVILWTGGWFYLTGLLRERFAAALDAARAQGWAIEAGTPSRAGFPFAAAIAVPDMRLGGGTALPLAGQWRLPRLVLALTLTSPETLALGLPGGFDIQPPQGSAIAVRAATLVGTLPLTGTRSVEFDATDIAATRDGAADGAAARLQLRLEPKGRDLGFLLALDDVRLPPRPPAHPWVLGPRLSSLVAAGSAEAALAVPGGQGALAAWLGAWREAGGALILERLALGWGPLGVAGQARIALDAALQPDIRAGLTVLGYNEAIAALARAGFMRPGPALAAQFALGLLARPGEAGARPRLEAAATLRDGRFALGGVELGEVPPLSWPDKP